MIPVNFECLCWKCYSWTKFQYSRQSKGREDFWSLQWMFRLYSVQHWQFWAFWIQHPFRLQIFYAKFYNFSMSKSWDPTDFSPPASLKNTHRTRRSGGQGRQFSYLLLATELKIETDLRADRNPWSGRRRVARNSGNPKPGVGFRCSSAQICQGCHKIALFSP